MIDLVEREEVIKAIDKRICELQRHPVFKRKNADIDLYGVKKLIMRLPSAEPTWTDTLAELHERFSALEKEIRRASAEMSAIIREYVDKDINVRSKDEPQTCSVSGRPYSECADCEYFKCTADEPQTEDEILREQCRAFMGIVEQTEREGE